MLRVYIVRHGETDWNVEGRIQGWTDTPLNAKGEQQARLIAERLGEEGRFSAIISSPLQRAWYTAEAIGGAVGLVPVADDRLKERSLGVVEGLNSAEIEQTYPELYRQWRHESKRVAFPGEEPREGFQGRTSEFLKEVESSYPEGRVVVVTHGGVLAMIMATVMRLDMERHFPFWFDNACLNVVEFGGRVPRILTLNDTCHLRNGISHPGLEQELALDAKTGDDGAELQRAAS